MFWLWHLWLTTTNLFYSFPLLETSATALCGTTGNWYHRCGFWSCLAVDGNCNYHCDSATHVRCGPGRHPTKASVAGGGPAVAAAARCPGLVVLVLLPLDSSACAVVEAIDHLWQLFCYNARIVLWLRAFGQWRWDALKTSVDAALVPSTMSTALLYQDVMWYK